jgi:membrane-associated protease RseP (regulator of RpoE activity)
MPTFVAREGVARRRAARPTAREWARHATLFLLTALTMTWAGMTLALPFGDFAYPAVPAPVTLLDYVLYVPSYLLLELMAVASYAFAHPFYIGEGLKFAAALLSILLAHEAGHYVACRRYGVDATLPFFIPMPPPFLAGTLGAFIKIKSPIPSHRALFDIGVAGPLAGFVALLPVAVAAVLTAVPDTRPLPGDGTALILNNPLLLRLLAAASGAPDISNLMPNPYHIAAWFGLLVTSLNLLPVGQLDGGHATYALFGVRAHRRIGQLAFVSVLVLAPLGLFWHGSPGGFLYAVLLFVMLRVRHPEAENVGDTLGRARLFVALLTLLVFLLCFTPFPLTIK